ncbi:MAG TPA: L-histidine N(alpha)-methyltransferase [Stellaceae bacterium]|nr:L-histidine N(alpha)-methyltransferase [Stellaceae bacterium]
MMRDGNLAAFLDMAPVEESFRDAALAGLSRTEKSIPCRFLYDRRGSALFEAICELPEYYVTRTEMGILAARAGAIAERVGPRAQLVEFGSGASRKVRLLLEALRDLAAYVPVDISRAFLRQAASSVAADFPDVEVSAICADYSEPRRLPVLPLARGGRRVGFFPGSTIGNLMPEEAVSFLSGCREALGPGSGMIVGVDLKKDPTLLHDAYNDAAGITAEFILNILDRMNRELGADFNRARFRYDASYNEEAGRIEIYIRSTMAQIVTVARRPIVFSAGERLHVEYSYKYAVEEFAELARRAGYRSVDCWTDERKFFSVHYLQTG